MRATPPENARGRPRGRPHDRPHDAPPSAYNVAPKVAHAPDVAREPGQQEALRARRRLYAAETEPRRLESMRELEELFDRRHDGVAAARRFQNKLRWHVAVFGDGTTGTSAARILGDLTREERRLQLARERRPA